MGAGFCVAFQDCRGCAGGDTQERDLASHRRPQLTWSDVTAAEAGADPSLAEGPGLEPNAERIGASRSQCEVASSPCTCWPRPSGVRSQRVMRIMTVACCYSFFLTAQESSMRLEVPVAEDRLQFGVGLSRENTQGSGGRLPSGLAV